MNFYTIREAADAIAEQLHPENAERRQCCADRYRHLLYGALCGGAVTGRYEGDLDPIDHRRLGAPIAFHDCRISESDLNGWLVEIGNGVQVSKASCATDKAAASPTSKDVASVFGPYLCNGWTAESLLRRLNDVAGDNGLESLRSLVGDRRKLARWDAAGLARLLVERGAMMDLSAWQCIEKNYPEQIGRMGEKPKADRNATWYSGLTARGDLK